MKLKFAQILGVAFALLLSAGLARAGTFQFVTPAGSMTSGPVSASAAVTTGAGTVTITLNNLQANITDVAQAISDFDFVLSNGATTGTLSTTLSSAQQITVNNGGTYALGSTVTNTGWGVNSNVSGGIQIDALGFIGPAGLIIGPPDASNLYSNANGSIAGNGPHNPFYNQSATFVLNVAGVTSATTVTSATFSFGTTAGVNVPGTGQTPEPGTLALFGSGLLGVAGIVRRKFALGSK